MRKIEKIDESGFQPNALKVFPYISRKVKNGNFKSVNSLNPTHSEPIVAQSPSNAPKSLDGEHSRLASEKKKKIQIVYFEDSKPADSSSTDTAPDNKFHKNTQAKIDRQQTSIVSVQKSQEATRSPKDVGIAVAKIQSTQAKTPNLIAKKRGNKQETRMGIDKRLERFLDIYCRAYEEKNLTKFVNFFTSTAQENGKSLYRLLPKYNKNFSSIDKIKYQIKILKYSYDLESGIVDFEVKFAL